MLTTAATDTSSFWPALASQSLSEYRLRDKQRGFYLHSWRSIDGWINTVNLFDVATRVAGVTAQQRSRGDTYRKKPWPSATIHGETGSLATAYAPAAAALVPTMAPQMAQRLEVYPRLRNTGHMALAPFASYYLVSNAAVLMAEPPEVFVQHITFIGVIRSPGA